MGKSHKAIPEPLRFHYIPEHICTSGAYSETDSYLYNFRCALLGMCHDGYVPQAISLEDAALFNV